MDQRRQQLGLSWREVAAEAGITQETLRAIRRGANDPSTLTKRGIERALEWSPGSVDRVFAGDDPGASGSGPGRAAHRYRITDEEVMNSGLRPEAIRAALRLRRRLERQIAERDEDAIQRDDRLLGALNEEQDTA
jgi:transcriptional regulator with XRE-family HTH domain